MPALMSGKQAATIGGAIGTLICWGFECWVDGHVSKSVLAGAAIGVLLRELCVILFAGGEEPPEEVAQRVAARAAATVEQYPSDDRAEVAAAVRRIGR